VCSSDLRPGRSERPALVLAGPHRVVTSVLLGGLDLAETERAGLTYDGDADVLCRVRPRTPAVQLSTPA